MFAASAGAAKSLQKFSFSRQPLNNPELPVRQDEKERIRNGAPEWLTNAAGLLENKAKNSHTIIMFCGSLGSWQRLKSCRLRSVPFAGHIAGG